jgi:ribosome maturation factor RimP
MDIRQQIEDLTAPFLEPIDAFIVDMQIVSENRQRVIKLFVDTDTGITIGQCTDLSRKLGGELDSKDSIPSPYVLEISSPDLTKPLKLLRQYKKNIGRKFRVRFRKGDQAGEVVGVLIEINNDILTFNKDKNTNYIIPFNEIVESIEELPW